jgi:pSer/pThr/pTyr-binding forkhead associated (FHA) protein
LDILENGKTIEQHTLSPGEYLVGSSSKANVFLSHPFVSAKHGTLVLDEQGVFFRDHSCNGSFVHGKRIRNWQWSPGQDLWIPPFRLRFSSKAVSMDSSKHFVVIREKKPWETQVPSLPQEPTQGEPQGLWKLMALSSQNHAVPQIFTINKAVTRVGRSDNSDFQLMDPSVSRNHAEFILNPHGVLTVRDANSQNGIAVNGHRVASQELKEGDIVHIGPRLPYKLIQSARESL